MENITMTLLYILFLTATHKNVADINGFGSMSFPFLKDIKLYSYQVGPGH